VYITQSSAQGARRDKYANIQNMSSKPEKFARNLVKGKIAETVFAQMLREVGGFTVLEFGYEKVIPELLNKNLENKDVKAIQDIIRHAPDFAVINTKKRSVHLIEVKYQKRLSKKYILEDAERMHVSWNPSYLFIATLDGFYFDEITKIIKNDGDISPLDHPQIPHEVQERYLQILRDFESKN
jgi:hypothetical protein